MQVVEVPDSGHFIAEERPDLVASTIRELLGRRGLIGDTSAAGSRRPAKCAAEGHGPPGMSQVG